MEGLQAKENTVIERKAKESPFDICQEIREADSRRFGQYFYLQTSVLNIFSGTLIHKTISYGARRKCYVPPAFQVKQSEKVMV